jgi:CBS domain-containing protein
MTPGVSCARPEDTLVQAANDMKDLDVGALPVCGTEEKLVGMITDRDIAIRATADGLDPRQTYVQDVMSSGIVCCYEDEDVAAAARLMESKQIRRIVVLNRDKRMVGILSLGDLAVRTQDLQMCGEALQEVSEPTSRGLLAAN